MESQASTIWTPRKGSGYPAAHGENIGVVYNLCPFTGENRICHTGINPPVLVGHYRHTLAGPADKNTPVGFAPGDCTGYFGGLDNIGPGLVLRFDPEVIKFNIIPAFQIFDDRGFQRKNRTGPRL